MPYSTPAAAFNSNGSASNKTINAGSTVSFTDLSTNFPTGWEWNITPATGWSFASGSAGSKNPVVKFNSVGTYSVSLKCSNPGGNNTITKTNHITVIPTRPVVDFNVNSGTGSVVGVEQNTIASFNDQSLYEPTSWTWTISPNSGVSYVSSTSANSKNPLVSFSNVGRYTISLTAANGGGSASKSKTNYVVVIPPTPDVNSQLVTYCQGAVAAPLQATGTALKWYTVETGGTGSSTAPVPSTATPGNTTYYVTQTVGGFESYRLPVIVKVNTLPAAPSVTAVVTHCTGASVPALTAVGSSLKWYTIASGGSGTANAPVPNTSFAGSTNYYVSQTNSNGCEGTRATITVNVLNQLPVPVTVSPVNYCLNGPATPLIARTTVGTGLEWFTVASGGTGSTDPIVPATDLSGSATYYVAQTLAGCASGLRAAIQVNTNTTPTPDTPSAASPVIYTQGQDALPLSASGTDIKWYNRAVGDSPLPFAPVPLTGLVGTQYFFVTQTVSGCESRRQQVDFVTLPGVPVAPPNWDTARKMSLATTETRAGRKIAVGSDGVVVTGEFSGNINLGKNTSGADVIFNTSLLIPQTYIVKYRTDGKIAWAYQSSGSTEVYPSAVHSGGGAGYYLTGLFSGTISFGTATLTSDADGGDMYFIRFKEDGTIAWAKTISGVGEYAIYPGGITADRDGNIFVAGTFQTSISFNTTTLTGGKVFIARYDNLGNLIWATNDAAASGIVQRIDVDQLGNLYIGCGSSLLQYSSGGQALRKVDYTREASMSFASINAVAADKQNNLFVAGSFKGTIRFDSSTVLSADNNKSDMYVAKYDPFGQLLWIRRGGGNSGNDAAQDIVTDDFGNAYVCGTFYGTASFGSIQVTSIAGRDAFILKYGAQGNEVWLKHIKGDGEEEAKEIGINYLGTLYTGGYGNGVVFDSVPNLPTITGRYLARLGNSLPTPAIYDIAPRAANPGTTVTIIGKGLINTGYIDFNGTIAERFSVKSASMVEVMVPFGATTGKVSLSTNIGSITDTAYFIIKENTFADDSLPPGKWSWAKLINKYGAAPERVPPPDQYGNIYKAGVYSYQIDIVDTLLTGTDIPGRNAIYVARYDASEKFKWALSSGGSVVINNVSILTDKHANVLITGYIGHSPGEVFTLGNNSLQASGWFTAKLDSSGNVLWLKQFEGLNSTNYGFQQKLDQDGNIITTGTLNGTVRFGSLEATSTGQYGDYFLLKQDPSGNSLWIRQTPAHQFASPLHVQTDHASCVLFALNDSLYKYAADGNLMWVKKAIIGMMKTDADNNIYTTGDFTFENDLDFGSVVLRTSYGISGFLSCTDANGNLRWARKTFEAGYDPFSTEGQSHTADLDVDGAGNIYITGQYYTGGGDVVLGNKRLQVSGVSNILIAKYKGEGALSWFTGVKAEGGTGKANPTGIFVTGPDQLLLKGLISNTYFRFGDTLLYAPPYEADPNGFYPASFMAKMGEAPPVIDSFTLTEGVPGDTVTIYGTNFSNAVRLFFNNRAADSFTVTNARQIRVVVPDSAISGAITLQTTTGSGKSKTDYIINNADSGDVKLCPGSNAYVNSDVAGTTYQWQVNGGSGFVNITDTATYADFTTRRLHIKNTNSGMYGYQYRCIVNGGSTSRTIALRFVSYWSGSEDIRWENVNNWGCSKTVPDVSTDVFIASGTVLINSNVLVRSLTVNPGVNIIIKDGYSLEIIKQR